MTEAEVLITEFRSKRSLYEDFTNEISQLIATLLRVKKIDVSSIEPRTKSIASFEEKVLRDDKAGKYEQLLDVTDLSGIRIICFLEEDCSSVCRIIEDNFDIDRANSTDKSAELDENRFGYLSTHYVLSLNGNRSKLPEFARFQDLKAEIQVRTLLQHTWAAIDWKFRYKTEREAPKSLKRRLFRISALLEAADNEFSAVHHELKQLLFYLGFSIRIFF